MKTVIYRMYAHLFPPPPSAPFWQQQYCYFCKVRRVKLSRRVVLNDLWITLIALVGTVSIQNELNDVNWIELIWMAWWERILRPSNLLARPAYLPCLPKVANSSVHQNRRLLGRPPLSWIWFIRQEWLAPFRDCTLSIFIVQLNTRTNYPKLFQSSLRPATTPHSTCSLLHTVNQDTPVIKPNLISRSDRNRPLQKSISNNTQPCLVQRWYRARGPNDSIPFDTLFISSSQLLVYRVLEIDLGLQRFVLKDPSYSSLWVFSSPTNRKNDFLSTDCTLAIAINKQSKILSDRYGFRYTPNAYKLWLLLQILTTMTSQHPRS